MIICMFYSNINQKEVLANTNNYNVTWSERMMLQRASWLIFKQHWSSLSSKTFSCECNGNLCFQKQGHSWPWYCIRKSLWYLAACLSWMKEMKAHCYFNLFPSTVKFWILEATFGNFQMTWAFSVSFSIIWLKI